MLWKIVFQWVHEERMDDDQEYKVGPAPDQTGSNLTSVEGDTQLQYKYKHKYHIGGNLTGVKGEQI